MIDRATLKFPFYAKAALISIGAFAFVFTLYIGQHIILPIIYATIMAILLNPVVNFLVRHKFNRIIAITLTVLVSILICCLFMYFIYTQLSLFSDTFPKLKEKFSLVFDELKSWVSVSFNIRPVKIDAWVKHTQTELVNNMGGVIGQTLMAINSIVIICVLLPVYLFMILYYKCLLLEFIRKLFNSHHHGAVFEVLINSKKIIQSYLFGLIVEAIIIAALNSIALLCLGIDYAVILGILGAIINVIPYIGGVVAVALPMMIAFVTKDNSSYPLLVLVVYMFIQFADNHYIIPKIVASRVKINALVSVVVVLVGAEIWGVPGMFLSIPLTAIMKVVFDHIESLKPWGYLLGNIVPTASKLSFGILRKRKKTEES